MTDFVVFEPANAIKFTIRRLRPSGSMGESDLFGAQQYARRSTSDPLRAIGETHAGESAADRDGSERGRTLVASSTRGCRRPRSRGRGRANRAVGDGGRAVVEQGRDRPGAGRIDLADTARSPRRQRHPHHRHRARLAARLRSRGATPARVQDHTRALGEASGLPRDRYHRLRHLPRRRGLGRPGRRRNTHASAATSSFSAGRTTPGRIAATRSAGCSSSSSTPSLWRTTSA